MMYEDKRTIDFDSLRLTLASPTQIHVWSRGEVLKPETVNYRTQKPEKDGLFCERIFGPSKDWECYCGKYKKIRYKGIVCDKCGVEVTRSAVRRERMGHIDLAAPCSHIWFLRGVPSKIGLALDLSPQALEKVLYFANFIITDVNADLKKETIEQIKLEFKSKKKKIDADFNQQLSVVKSRISQDQSGKPQEEINQLFEQETIRLEDVKKERVKELEQALAVAEQELKDLKPLKIISEHAYQDLSLKYGHLFEAGIGAEAIHALLTEINLEDLIAREDVVVTITETGYAKRTKTDLYRSQKRGGKGRSGMTSPRNTSRLKPARIAANSVGGAIRAAAIIPLSRAATLGPLPGILTYSTALSGSRPWSLNRS